ncbi:MAG: pentapeptide repeat-containing protein [Calothrix sp. C42_A2020_038]|nr:pentapeptide repeat-containing protein [Calothrix sp. C42_A2020_038]
MNWRLLKILIVSAIGINIVIAPHSALADWTHPMSFSNAELSRRDFSGQILQACEFSNANMELTNFSDADLRGAVMSASVMTKANLHRANLSNALVDQVNLTGADLSDAILKEALLLRATFKDINIDGADFTDAVLDGAQVKELCSKASGVNSQTGVQTRDSLGCR